MGTFSTFVVLVLWASSDVSHALGGHRDAASGVQDSAVIDDEFSLNGDAGAREILQVSVGYPNMHPVKVRDSHARQVHCLSGFCCDAGDPLIIADTNGSSNFGPGNPRFDVMVGVLSMLPDGCEELRNGFSSRPSVFTRLSSFTEWIKENTKSESLPQAESEARAKKDTEGATPSAAAFLNAAKDGDLQIVKQEVENGVDMEARSTKKDTALIIAAVNNHPDVVRYLVEKGANLEPKGHLGFTPAIVLAFFGRTELLQLLLERGVDVETRSDEGAAALFYAAERNHLGAVRALLDAGAAVDVRFERTGATPLMIAAERSNIHVVQELISRGADVNVENNVQKTPLHSAAQGSKNSDVIFALIDAGADVNGQDQDGHTALHYATWNGRKSNYDALLSRGADPQILTIDGKAPLDMLCSCKTTTPSKRTNCFFEFCENDEAQLRAEFG
ncbi:hypothetical protein BSKO_04732 [Bryopsis sp. KO-2023]|nr:hypothetical protein BSKO_04732 [Bryopsis sp. KO-2023]